MELYSDDELTSNVVVVAVRAQAPGLTIGPLSDPADLGLAAAQQEVVHVGDVDCNLVRQTLVAAGKPVDPQQERTVSCQRTGAGLTVIVTGNTGDGPSGQRQMVRATDEAWEAVDAG